MFTEQRDCIYDFIISMQCSIFLACVYWGLNSVVERVLCKILNSNSQFLLHSLYVCVCRGNRGKACIRSWKPFRQDDEELNSQQESATSDLVIPSQDSTLTLHRTSPFSKCLFAANSYEKVLLIPQLWAKACECVPSHLAFVVVFSCCKCISNSLLNISPLALFLFSSH